MLKIHFEIEKARKEIIEKSSHNDVLNLKAQLLSSIEAKVDLKEVQQVLNDCQKEICGELQSFKQNVQEDMS